MYRILLVGLLMLAGGYNHSTAQNISPAPDIGVGTWLDHFPFQKGTDVVAGDGVIYCASEFAMFSFDIATTELTRMTKTSGLSDAGIGSIAYNSQEQTLVVGYTNGNLDLVRSSGTTNLPFIKLSSTIFGSKAINNIRMKGSLAYLSCGFGIVVLDIANDEIKETYIIGPGNTNVVVYDTEEYMDSIYAATEDGLFKAYKDDPFLLDFSNWSIDTTLPIQVRSDRIVDLLPYNGKLYMLQEDPSDTLLHEKSGSAWITSTLPVGKEIYSMYTEGTNIYVSVRDTVYGYDSGDNVIEFRTIYDMRPSDAIKQGNDIYVASGRWGLVRFADGAGWKSYYPTGPESTDAFAIEASDGHVWVVRGSVTGSKWNQVFNQASMSSYIDNQWTQYNYAEMSELSGLSATDVVSVGIDPDDPNHVFVGTQSGAGLIELQDGAYVTNYDTSNSALQKRSDQASATVAVFDMMYDSDDDLWMINGLCQNPLVVRRAGGGWQSYDIGLDPDDLETYLEIDDIGQKWILAPGKGVVVYDSDNDESKLLTGTVNNGDLPSLQVESIAKDLDGEIWIGTDAGPVVFYSPESVFSGNNFDGQQILIQQDGIYQLLLETEVVTAIAVDGANRKWLGTQNSGVFLMSEDGTEEVFHFTTDNSPLLSNEIVSIGINDVSGEVYFGTDQGLVSYRGVATDGDPFFTDVYAYPNPVRETYSGPITIKGLARDSDVKITDISGKVIFFTTSRGGQAVWEGNNFNGDRAKTGVYLVFATDDNGDFAEVTKILLIN